VGDGLSRVHEAVNRAQGESLDAAQTTAAEIGRLLDAAKAELDQSLDHSTDKVLAEQRKLAGEMVEHLRKPSAADEEQLDAIAAVAERLVVLHEDTGRRAVELTVTVEQSAANAMRRLTEAEQSIASALAEGLAQGLAENRAEPVDTSGSDEELRKLREAVVETHKLAKHVDASVSGLPAAMRSAVEDVNKAVAEVAGSDRDRAEQAKAVLDAVARANQDHQEVLQALHSSLSKRFDARTKTIAETLDGLATSLEAARKLGPSLDKVSSRLDAQQPYLDQIRHQLVQLAATVASVPADVERRHVESSATMEKVADTLVALRTHAAALDRSVQAMRATQDGLTSTVIELRDDHGAVPQRLDHLGEAVQSGRKEIDEVGELTRAVAAAVEQQHAMGARLAELVGQVRSATRSDIERVESSIHLEVLKQHQQDQARLAQAVAANCTSWWRIWSR
jgi:uncharacterized phage infection (PIP) family protein YhgE